MVPIDTSEGAQSGLLTLNPDDLDCIILSQIVVLFISKFGLNFVMLHQNHEAISSTVLSRNYDYCKAICYY